MTHRSRSPLEPSPPPGKPFVPCVACVLLAVLAFSTLSGASACGPQQRMTFESAAPPRAMIPGAEYEALVRYYAELCALSQYRPLERPMGGSPGHAVLYLKGACREPDAPYPRLRRCEPTSSEIDAPDHGVGVSVNRWFRNVNWIAVPGRRLFYDGDLDATQTLTEGRRAAVVQRAIELGLYQGIELHDYPQVGPERSLVDFVSTHSVGTDLALRFGRTTFCARLPVTEPMLEEILAFLNELNGEYFAGTAHYNWSGYHDNCVHTLHNALAAASVWQPKSVNVVKIRQFFHLAIPANQAVDLARLVTSGPLDDFPAIYRNDAHRNALLAFDWLPTRHAALLVTLPVHPENEVYDTRLRLFALQRPFGTPLHKSALALASQERFRSLEANLRHFIDLYDELLREGEGVDLFAFLGGDPFRMARSRYRRYLEVQRADAAAMLAQLRGGDDATDPF